LGDNVLVGPSKNTFHVGLGSVLHFSGDFGIGGIFLESGSKINNGNVGGWDSESHTSEFAVKLWDNLSDGFGGSSGGWDNVGTSGSTGSPVFSSLGWSINGELVHGDGMDGGHESLFDSPLVVENFGDWGKAVGCARSVGNDLHVRGVAIVVDTNNEDWGIILWWGREDDFLGSSLDVKISLLLGKENTG